MHSILPRRVLIHLVLYTGTTFAVVLLVRIQFLTSLSAALAAVAVCVIAGSYLAIKSWARPISAPQLDARGLIVVYLAYGGPALLYLFRHSGAWHFGDIAGLMVIGAVMGGYGVAYRSRQSRRSA